MKLRAVVRMNQNSGLTNRKRTSSLSDLLRILQLTIRETVKNACKEMIMLDDCFV